MSSVNTSDGSRPTVGFIGLGRMGLPMARNLLRTGFPVVAHNRSRGNVDIIASEGAVKATSPAEVARSSHIVLTCLPDVPAVEQVYFGENGLLPAIRPGHLLIDHSTVGPTTSQQIAKAASQRGAPFLDAPISGGIERAADATLTIMVGGDRQAFDAVLPVMQGHGHQGVLRGSQRSGQRGQARQPANGWHPQLGRRLKPWFWGPRAGPTPKPWSKSSRQAGVRAS